MANLTPEERARIEAEERAKIEKTERAKIHAKLLQELEDQHSQILERLEQSRKSAGTQILEEIALLMAKLPAEKIEAIRISLNLRARESFDKQIEAQKEKTLAELREERRACGDSLQGAEEGAIAQFEAGKIFSAIASGLQTKEEAEMLSNAFRFATGTGTQDFLSLAKSAIDLKDATAKTGRGVELLGAFKIALQSLGAGNACKMIVDGLREIEMAQTQFLQGLAELAGMQEILQDPRKWKDAKPLSKKQTRDLEKDWQKTLAPRMEASGELPSRRDN